MLSFCILLGGSFFPSEAFQNEPRGFRGASWWSGNHRFSGLYSFEKDGSWEFCRREGESLLFGEAQLDDVLYYFVNQRFAGVFLGAYGRHNRDLLLQEASRRWGPGKAQFSGQTEYGRLWHGSSVMILFSYDPLSEESRLVMTPFFPWDPRGQDLEDLQRDFALLVKGKTPVSRSTPFRKETHLFSPAGDRYPTW